MRNQENTAMENDSYHHPGLLASLNEDGLDLKLEIGEKVQTGIGSSQEHEDPFLEKFVKSNDFYYHNVYEGDNGIELVPARWSPIHSKIENEVDFSVKQEENVELETSYQVEDFNEATQEKIVESVDVDSRQIMKNDGTELVPVEQARVDSNMGEELDFKVEIEENVKMEINGYQEQSEENLEEHFVEEEENIDDTMIQRIKETDNKVKRIAVDSRKRTYKYNTCQLERKFECHLCEYKASRKSHLDGHINAVHFKERKFECKLCKYRGNSKSRLDKHLNSVHLKVRNFECHLCDYRSHQKSDLEKHLSSVHLNERKFECHLCAYKSKRKEHLDTHLTSIHLNERKFKCHLCEYKANKKSNLNSHLRFIHFKERRSRK